MPRSPASAWASPLRFNSAATRAVPRGMTRSHSSSHRDALVSFRPNGERRKPVNDRGGAHQGLIPGNVEQPFRRQVARLYQLESHPPQTCINLPLLRDVRDPAAIFQIGLDPPVHRVPLIEPVGQAVFVGREAATRLQDPKRFGIDSSNVPAHSRSTGWSRPRRNWRPARRCS